MIEMIRAHLNRVFLKNHNLAKWYFYLLHQYDDKFHKMPLLIHQMGKVGSSSVYHTVYDYIKDRNIYHIHNLNESLAKRQLSWGLQKIKETGNKRRYDELWHSLYLSKRVTRTNGQWPIITLVRDPVARNVSWFFQVMDRLYPELYQNGINEDFDHKKVQECFLSIDENHHRLPLEWLDFQLRDIFGLDVFSEIFPKDEGV